MNFDFLHKLLLTRRLYQILLVYNLSRKYIHRILLFEHVAAGEAALAHELALHVSP